jgi:O-antigen/teichoic acid export membrane protein
VSDYKKSLFWNSAGSTAFAANSVLMSLFVTRVCGIEVAGVFGVSWAIALNLYPIGLFGLGSYQSTDIKKNYSFSEYFTTKLISTLIMILSACIVVYVLTDSKTEKTLICLLTAFLLVYSFAELFQSLFCQCRRIDLAGKSLFVRTVVSFIFFLGILLIFNSLFIAILIMILSNIITGLIVTLKPAFSFERIKLSSNYKKIYALISECFPIFLSSFILMLKINCPRYILKMHFTDATLGYFNIIYLPIVLMQMISNFIIKPMIPKYFDFINNGEYDILIKYMAKQIIFVFISTLLCIVAAYVFGMDILSILYGKDLRPFKFEMVLVLLSGFIYSITMFMYNILIIMRCQRIVFGGYVLSLLITFLVGLVFIKKYSMIGAISSFAIGEIFLLVFFVIVLGIKMKKSLPRLGESRTQSPQIERDTL